MCNETERELLMDAYKLHPELGTARNAAAQQLTRLDDENLPPTGRANLQQILDAFRSWMPGEVQPLTFPHNDAWFNFFSCFFRQSNFIFGCPQFGQVQQENILNARWVSPGWN